MKYTKTSPCEQCPFRTDIPPFLTRGRGKEIANALRGGGEFPCHKTTIEVEDEDGGSDREPTKNSLFCAGALIVMEKEEAPNQMMRICERLGLYDHRKLDMKAPVFDSLDDFAKAQGLTRDSAKHVEKIIKNVKKRKRGKR